MTGVRGASLIENGIYKNRHGGKYRCLSTTETTNPILKNIDSGWTFVAEVITMYEDGTIEWDYSHGGMFK